MCIKHNIEFTNDTMLSETGRHDKCEFVIREGQEIDTSICIKLSNVSYLILDLMYSNGV